MSALVVDKALQFLLRLFSHILYIYFWYIAAVNDKLIKILYFLLLHLLIYTSVLFLQLLMESLILSVMYVWCQLNADVIVTFWFGMKFKVSVVRCIHHYLLVRLFFGVKLVTTFSEV